MPKVSIIIPCYNQEEFLEKTLQSVENQTFSDWECLLIDDGSIDKTGEIAKSWSEKDSRFKYHKRENQGVTKTRDFGLEQAKGEWIQFLDGDDLLDKNKLEESLKFKIEANIIITNFAMIYGEEISEPFCDLTKYEFNFEHLISGWDIDFNLPIHCVLMNKSILGNTRFRTDLKAKEDWVFWLDIFEKNEVKVKFIDEKLCFYRHNPNGASKQFLSVYEDNFTANKFVFDKYGDHAKSLLFNRLNQQNLDLNKNNFHQKNHIRKLQSTKVLKVYLNFREKLSKIFNRS